MMEARPKVAAKRGHSAAAMAKLMPTSTHAPRAHLGQPRGADASSRRATARRAAVPPKLMSAPGDNAASGRTASKTAAAKVNVAEGVVARSQARASAAAVSMSHARSLGRSAPAMRT
jgi:hypothetical protein